MDGYMMDVQFDGETLRVHGKNKAARIALNVEDHEQDVALTAGEVAGVEYTAPKLLGMINGRVMVRTTGGRTHVLHFRGAPVRGCAPNGKGKCTKTPLTPRANSRCGP